MVTEGAELAGAVLELDGCAPELRMKVTNGAGILAAEQGDFTASRRHFEESRELARAAGNRRREVRAGANLGILAMYEDDHETAIERYQEAVELARELGDDRTLSLMTQNLGIAHDAAGQPALAIEALEEAITLARTAGDPAHLGSCQQTLARVLLDVDRERALVLLRESTASAHRLGDTYGTCACLETVAGAVAEGEDPHLGAMLWGAAQALRAQAGATRQPDETAFATRVEAALRTALGEEGFSAAGDEGAALELDEAVARALAI
jgi:tetratricopeptide (TPR) repeat protein